MTRVLIVHASVGMGHTSAAKALTKAFQMRQTEQVWCEDALDYGSTIFREIYAGSYLEALREDADLVGIFLRADG